MLIESFVREDETSFSVRRESMVSQDVYDWEQTAIWDRSWLYVGHESEIPNPNDFHCRDVGNRPVIFCRDADGEITVLLNVCAHRGAIVCRDREGSAARFTCMYHSWTYDNKGQLVAQPGRESYPPEFSKVGKRLGRPARVSSYRGFVFLSFNENVAPLEEHLAGARHYLDLVADQSAAGMEVLRGTHEYSTEANWKLLVENSADGYHGMPVHSTYFDLMKDLGDDISPGARYGESHGLDLGNGHGVITRRTPMFRAVARWAPSVGPDLRPVLEGRYARLVEAVGENRAVEIANTDFNLVVFPNLFVISGMGTVIRSISSPAVDRVLARAWLLAPVDQTPEERHATVEQSLMFFGPGGWATPDDAEVLQLCQSGLRAWKEVPWSDISKGLGKDEPDTRDELQMRAFWRHYEEMMMLEMKSR